MQDRETPAPTRLPPHQSPVRGAASWRFLHQHVRGAQCGKGCTKSDSDLVPLALWQSAREKVRLLERGGERGQVSKMGRVFHESEGGLGSVLRSFLLLSLMSSLLLLPPHSVLFCTREHVHLEAGWRKGGGMHKEGDHLGPCWAPCCRVTWGGRPAFLRSACGSRYSHLCSLLLPRKTERQQTSLWLHGGQAPVIAIPASCL